MEEKMRIVRDDNPGAHNVRVSCIECGGWHWLYKMSMDLDGPAFKAYVCDACLPAYTSISRETGEEA